MNGCKIKCLISALLVLSCITLNSCKIPLNTLNGFSEVDFTTVQKVQITFKEHIYDTTIVSKNSKLEINFINEKDLLNGAYVCLTNSSYKITYKDMIFNGDIVELSSSFLPCIIKNFLQSFEDKIILDSYDNNRRCYYIKKTVSGYFVTLECYENNGIKVYSMEIK